MVCLLRRWVPAYQKEPREQVTTSSGDTLTVVKCSPPCVSPHRVMRCVGRVSVPPTLLDQGRAGQGAGVCSSGTRKKIGIISPAALNPSY